MHPVLSYHPARAPSEFPRTVGVTGFRRSPQIDRVAGRSQLANGSFIYCRAASLWGCKVSGAALQKVTLLRLLLPLNDQV